VALVRLQQVLVRVGYVEPRCHFGQVDVHEVVMFGVHLELGDAPAFLVVSILGPDALSAWDELQLGQLAVVGLGDAALSGELTLDRCHV